MARFSRHDDVRTPLPISIAQAQQLFVERLRGGEVVPEQGGQRLPAQPFDPAGRAAELRREIGRLIGRLDGDDVVALQRGDRGEAREQPPAEIVLPRIEVEGSIQPRSGLREPPAHDPVHRQRGDDRAHEIPVVILQPEREGAPEVPDLGLERGHVDLLRVAAP